MSLFSWQWLVYCSRPSNDHSPLKANLACILLFSVIVSGFGKRYQIKIESMFLIYNTIIALNQLLSPTPFTIHEEGQYWCFGICRRSMSKRGGSIAKQWLMKWMVPSGSLWRPDYFLNKIFLDFLCMVYFSKHLWTLDSYAEKCHCGLCKYFIFKLCLWTL